MTLMDKAASFGFQAPDSVPEISRSGMQGSGLGKAGLHYLLIICIHL